MFGVWWRGGGERIGEKRSFRKLPSLWREGAGGGRGDPNQVLLSNPHLLQDQAQVSLYSLFQAFGFESIVFIPNSIKPKTKTKTKSSFVYDICMWINWWRSRIREFSTTTTTISSIFHYYFPRGLSNPCRPATMHAGRFQIWVI